MRKNYEVADVICYLPLDSKSKANKFLDIVHPELVVFVKYEFWPNVLNELKSRGVKTILISGAITFNKLTTFVVSIIFQIYTPKPTILGFSSNICSKYKNHKNNHNNPNNTKHHQ